MKTSSSKKRSTADKPRCGLCGKTTKLMRTDCCGQWICNDEHKYVLFSYARNSCSRNHRRYTLCGFHHAEGHPGDWKTCRKCRESFQAEMVVWYGTNEYNFEKLPDPPAYEPTHCDRCGVVIKLGTDGYSTGPEGTLCERCSEDRFTPPPPPSKGPRSRRREPGA
jgi:hypothetical protein